MRQLRNFLGNSQPNYLFSLLDRIVANASVDVCHFSHDVVKHQVFFQASDNLNMVSEHMHASLQILALVYRFCKNYQTLNEFEI